MNPPTHAGGVVFRYVGDKVEFLIVQARDNPEGLVTNSDAPVELSRLN